MAQSVTITMARNDSYNTTEKVEIKIDIPDAEIAATIYAQLRNDARRLEDGIRERVTTLMMPPPALALAFITPEAEPEAPLD